MMKLTKKEFEKILKDKVVSECGVTLDVASAEQIYRCMAMIVRQIMSDRQKQFQAKTLGEGKKQVYDLCMEFLMGRSLRTSLFNLGLNEVAEQVLADADIKIDTIYEQEPDAGLGNGGLGRLAACYLDGMATDCIPGTGYSILYEYGIFKQKIVDGWQQETADNWLPGGQVWIKSHPDQAQEIRFDGQAIETWEGGFHHVKYENYNSVIAVPNEMYVAGYGTQGVSKLPSHKALQAEIEQLTAEKNAHYNEYREKKARVKELHTVKSNLSQILQGEKDREKKHKHER